MERWLAIEICEQYRRRVHRSLRRSPLAAWHDALSQVGGGLGALPDQPDQFAWSFLPCEQRTLRRDGLHLFNIRYWDSVLPVIVKLGESVLVRYAPRNLSKVYVTGSDARYHPIPYADLTLPPITLWEQRAAMAKLRVDGNNASAQAKMFEAVLDQRALVEQANAKTKAARRSVQRRNDAVKATVNKAKTARGAVGYSKPVKPAESELWDDSVVPQTFDHLHPGGWSLLEESHEDRITRLYMPKWVSYEGASEGLARMEHLLRHPPCGRMPSVLRYGDIGKTMIVDKFVRDHPNICNQFGEVEARKVLRLQMSSKPNDGRLYAQIIDGLGHNAPHTRRGTDLEILALRLRHRKPPQLMIVDEVQHLLAGTVREQRQSLSQLKFLSNELRMPVAALTRVPRCGSLS